MDEEKLPETHRDDSAPFPTIGPYRILSVLGRGGMGIVYGAVHSETGAQVALKTVPAPSARHVQLLRREIQALARVRHPGIVRILDEGVTDGVPWCAMELVEGESVRDRYLSPRTDKTCGRTHDAAQAKATTRVVSTEPEAGRQAPTFEVFEEPARGRLDEALDLVLQLCSPLAYLHGEGIVHRDLKPDNILVRASGRPVIVDFGLTRRFFSTLGRESLEVDEELVGTIHYMSPEQIQGSDVDARADLYSLGCIIYELLTGRPPFTGAWGDVIHGHLTKPPAPPSALVAGIPGDLDHLVLRLLGKSRPERPGYADDVARSLGAILGKEGHGVAAAPRTYLYRPGFFGRSASIGVLRKHIEDLDAGVGSAVLVMGEAGSGKTRLVLEAAANLPPGVEALSGECLPRSTASDGSRRPLEPFVGILLALADRCRAKGPEETARIFGDRAPILSRYQPALCDLSPGPVPSPQPDLPLGVARQRVFLALCGALRALAASAPLLLILDDLHWADELTVGFLQLFLRELAEEPAAILLIATCRSEESGPEVATIRERCRILALPSLDRAAVGTMVSDMLALDPCPAELFELIDARCRGNPFFVAEHLRAAVSEGVIRRDPERGWMVSESAEDLKGLAMPPSIRAMVARRIGSLDEASQLVLQAAAVFRSEVGEEALASMLRCEAPIAASLPTLVLNQILEERAPGTYRFAHEELRRATYESTQEERRRELHRAAAEWRTGQKPEDQAVLGHHWEEGGVPERARACYLAGARHALGSFALADAEGLYRSYLALPGGPASERITVLGELGGKVLAHTGRSREAEEVLQLTVEQARAIGDRSLEANSLNQLALVKRRRGTLAEVRSLYAQVLQICRELGDGKGELVASSNLAIAHYGSGEMRQARELWEGVLAGVRAAGDRPREAVVLSNLAGLHLHEQRFEQAREMFESALAITRETGDRLLEGVFVGNLAITLPHLGRREESRRLFEAALARHRELGNRGSEGQLLRNYAKLHEDEGRFEEAEGLHRRSVDILKEIEDFANCATALTMMGDFLTGRGRRREAVSCYREARDMARAAGQPEAEEAAAAAMAKAEAAIAEGPPDGS